MICSTFEPPPCMPIGFNKPYLTGKELDFIQDAVQREKISGNGFYTQECQEYFKKRYGFNKSLLTQSCTDALEMSALLISIGPGDEIICLPLHLSRLQMHLPFVALN